MKRFSIFPRVFVPAFVITLIVSACGTKATPTINPIDLQSTAVAAAFTVVAETQAAIPTATPTTTSTNTPVFIASLPPLPTLGPTFTPMPGNSNAGDPCINQPLPASLTGQMIKIRIDNPTKATIMVSFNLQKGSSQSVCGYRGYSLTAGQSLVINNLIVGCYSVWAWNPDPKNYFMVTNGTSCLDNSANWTFDISPNGIKLR